MEQLIRNVRELDDADRAALERMVGHPLVETQQVIVNVVDLDTPSSGESEPRYPESDVPDWWKIYEGLSDGEIEELDRAIRQRADLTRHLE